MHKTIAIIAVVAAGVAGTAGAAEGFNYSYLEANYLKVSTQVTRIEATGNSAVDVDGNGFGMRGSLAFTGIFHGYLEYQKQDFAFNIQLQDQDTHVNLTLVSKEVGFGVNWPIASNIDLIGRGAYVKADSRVGLADHVVATDGYAAQAGVRALLNPRIEVEGLAHYVDLKDVGDTLSFRVSGRYHFTDMFSGYVGGEFDSDTTVWMAGIRVNFPKE